MIRHRLGSWTCPSGNSVDVFAVKGLADRVASLTFEWDSPPPLRSDDEHHYLTAILPAALRQLAEYEERPVGRTLVVRLENPR